MKKLLSFFSVLSLSLLSFGTERSIFAEDWKGSAEDSVLSIGGMTGLGTIDSTSGFALFGTVSKKIVKQGFVQGITNSVSIEGALGPVILSSATALVYSLHLRWDFEKDKDWTLYALGGLGGNGLSVANISRTEFFPRFGVGVFYKMSGPVNARFELSHEMIAVGVHVPFY